MQHKVGYTLKYSWQDEGKMPTTGLQFKVNFNYCLLNIAPELKAMTSLASPMTLSYPDVLRVI